MFDWIWNNKEWLFPCVVAIVIGVITWIITKRRSHKPQKVSLDGEPLQVIIDSPPPPKRAVDISTALSPKKIIEEINSAPLLQQPDLSKQYEGLKVSWKGTLAAADKPFDETVRLMIWVYEEDKETAVFFNIDPKQYPGIGLLREGHELLVEGKIDRIEHRHIVLDAENLVFNVDNSN